MHRKKVVGRVSEKAAAYSSLTRKRTAKKEKALKADEIIGQDGKIIRPVRYFKGRPVYAASDVPNMEARYSENVER